MSDGKIAFKGKIPLTATWSLPNMYCVNVQKGGLIEVASTNTKEKDKSWKVEICH